MTAGALAASLPGGCYPHSNECERLCRELEECGLLPSPLGADPEADVSDRERCVDRCSGSKAAVQEEFAACMREDDAPACDRNSSPADRWCCNRGCRQLAQCLEGIAGESVSRPAAAIVRISSGVTPVVTVPPAGCDTEYECAASAVIEAPAPGYCAGVTAAGPDGDVQVEPAIVGVRAFLETDQGVIRGADEACDHVVAQGVRFERVPAGAVRAGVRLELAPGAGPSCLVFWSQRYVVLPGREPTIPVVLPPRGSLLCPGTGAGGGGAGGASPGLPITCDDFQDAGLLGTCSRYFCEEDAQSCDDQKDNDGNGRVDCQEEACLAQPACQPSP